MVSSCLWWSTPSHRKILFVTPCYKIGPRSNNTYTVKSLNKMQNTLNTLQRDTNIMWFTQTMGYVHKENASPFITVQKDEGIQPTTKQLHFLFMLSQSLSHNHKYCLQCYNTIHIRVTMLSFIGEKYHGKILRLTQYHGSTKLLANKHPEP